jgi:hypothetical protein
MPLMEGRSRPQPPIILSGHRVTWFLPKPWVWVDPTGHRWRDGGAEHGNEGPYASGHALDDTLGIALPNRFHTLGGWWELSLTGPGLTAVVLQLDIGPTGTGTVDLNAPLAYAVFKAPDKVGDGAWSARYIGRTLPAGTSAGIFGDRRV